MNMSQTAEKKEIEIKFPPKTFPLFYCTNTIDLLLCICHFTHTILRWVLMSTGAPGCIMMVYNTVVY